MKANQKGFTLIELIVVIVILGILAATAMPKFVDLSGDARKSVVDGVEGAMRSANSMLYAKASAAGTLSGVVSVAGQSVTVANGFASNLAELKKVMDLDETKIATSGESLNYTGKTDCKVTYSAGNPPSYSNTASSSNC